MYVRGGGSVRLAVREERSTEMGPGNWILGTPFWPKPDLGNIGNLHRLWSKSRIRSPECQNPKYRCYEYRYSEC